ncbi:hypothetical protein DN42_3266 [Vibrio cholerae]|nr:hypothetical protein DN42_3266 [Vibrio cholerae]
MIDATAQAISLPHAGGGVSQFHCRQWLPRLSSPRRWGCFLILDSTKSLKAVFPTQVGVFPTLISMSQDVLRLPHAGWITEFYIGLIFELSVSRIWK